jgi:hypothetical protein
MQRNLAGPGGRQFFKKFLICCDLQGIFTLSSQNLDAHSAGPAAAAEPNR